MMHLIPEGNGKACKADEDDLKELEKEVASITTHKK